MVDILNIGRNKAEKKFHELKAKHDELTEIVEGLQELLEKLETDEWEWACKNVLEPERIRVLEAEHLIPVIAENGQPNIAKLSMAKGQANEVGKLLKFARVTRKAFDQAAMTLRGLNKDMSAVMAKLQDNKE